jgi:pyrimidine operon attenuation protein/uracil phosphoribosyltransferase
MYRLEAGEDKNFKYTCITNCHLIIQLINQFDLLFLKIIILRITYFFGMNKTQILNKKQIHQKLNRIAWQIFESNYEENKVVIVGISGNGYELAKRLSHIIIDISEIEVQLAEININKKEPFYSITEIELDEKEYTNKVVILVDDVLNSGKTMIYAVKHFLNVPLKKIISVTLIDRKHHRFPIRTDYSGLVLSTSMKDHVTVKLGENDVVYLK